MDKKTILTQRQFYSRLRASDRLPDCDFMIDYELEDDEINTIFYLKDNNNNYYITEV